MRGAKFAGTAAEFLTQVDRSEAASAASLGAPTIITDDGLVGISRSSSSPSGDRLDVAFKMAVGSEGAVTTAPALLVRAQTAPGRFETIRDTVAKQLASVRPGSGR